MANCKNCGFPLNKGNIQVIRKPGKRPYRIHRRCPEVVDVTALGGRPTFVAVSGNRKVTLNDVEGNPTIISREFNLVELSGNIEDTGSPLQRPQVRTGDPVVVEGVFNYPEPTRYRYFVTRATAEKLQERVERGGGQITVEIMPAPDYLVERDPEAFADYVEIEFKWKPEE